MASVLITGANRGIGLEFVQQYCQDGWAVIATCRNPQTAEKLHLLKEKYSKLAILQLDVTIPDQLSTVVDYLEVSALDVLIHNAAQFPSNPQRLEEIDDDPEEWISLFKVNAIAPLYISRILLPALLRSKQPKIVALSSVKASNARNHLGGAYQYRSSKAALNSIFRSLAVDLRSKGVIVVTLSVGWVPKEKIEGLEGMSFSERLRRARLFRQELGGDFSAQQTRSEAVRAMRDIIACLQLDHSGLFLDHKGIPLPW